MPLPRDYAERILPEAPFAWVLGERHQLTLDVVEDRIRASVDGNVVFAVDGDRPLRDGGVALVVEEGRTATRTVRIQPVEET